MFNGKSISILSLQLLSLMCVSLFTAWVTKMAYIGDARLPQEKAKLVKGFASLPHSFNLVLLSIREKISGEPNRLLIKKQGLPQGEISQNFPCSEDSGFLLLSGLDPRTKQCNIQLIRISDGNILKVWNPDWLEIDRTARSRNLGSFGRIETPIAGHPLPLEDGSIIFNVDGLTIHMDSGNNPRVHVMSVYSHHSLEHDCNQGLIVTPSVAKGFYSENKFLESLLIDDSILRFNLSGRIIENRSFSKILFDNGLDSLIFGHNGTRGIADDLIHINQIEVAHEDGVIWRRGDQLISERHLSAVFLYRPENNSIIWYRSGPWKNQHSVHFVNTNTIALLDNNVYGYDRFGEWDKNFVKKKDINRIFVIKFNGFDVAIEEPFRSILEADLVRPSTITQGRVRVLPDGGAFIEETNFGRHLRLSKNKLMWSRENYYSKDKIGYLGWSRYLTHGEGEKFLEKIRVAEKVDSQNRN